MPSEKLASVFSSCLFQTQGQTTQEISVVHDLISNYITLFSVSQKCSFYLFIYLPLALIRTKFRLDWAQLLYRDIFSCTLDSIQFLLHKHTVRNLWGKKNKTVCVFSNIQLRLLLHCVIAKCTPHQTDGHRSPEETDYIYKKKGHPDLAWGKKSPVSVTLLYMCGASLISANISDVFLKTEHPFFISSAVFPCCFRLLLAVINVNLLFICCSSRSHGALMILAFVRQYKEMQMHVPCATHLDLKWTTRFPADE